MQAHELQESLIVNLPALKEIDPTFAELYPVAPVVTAEYAVTLMNDMGTRAFVGGAEESPFDGVSELRTLFSELKTRTLAVSGVLAHTDALAHNIVLGVDSFGKKRMVFVDWDEGTLPGKIPERLSDKEKSGKRAWISHLMYPNGLRRQQQGDWYTRVQLAAALISLLSKTTDLSSAQESKLEKLIDQSRALARQLEPLTPVSELIENRTDSIPGNLAALDRGCDEFLSGNYF